MMRRYDIGDVAMLRHTVTDADGTLTDATVELLLTGPDGLSIDVGDPVNSSTGVYDVSVPLDDYGVYKGSWNVSGAITDVEPVKFYVADDDDDLPPLASLDRFARKLGYTPTGPEADRASEMLDAASTLIRDLAGKTWVVDGTGALETIPRGIVRVCIEAAFRAFGNPEALTQRSIGDSSKIFHRTGREGGEAVYLTKAEQRMVLANAGAASPVVVTMVSPYDGDDVDIDDAWVLS